MTNEMMSALSVCGGYMAVALAGVGSSIGAYYGGSAAIGAWKRRYVQDKPAPFLLLAMAGVPLSQTIYGMILMVMIAAKVAVPEMPGAEAMADEVVALAYQADFNAYLGNLAKWPIYLVTGIFGGMAMMFSALLQGKAAAGGCDAYGETDRGFANYLMVLGVIETVAIFALVFAIMVL